MKKTLLLLTILAGFAFGASAQCTPDSAQLGSANSYPDTVYAQAGTALAGQVISFKVPNDLSYSVTLPIVGPESLQVPVDSITIDSIGGIPSGITAVSSPAFHTWLHPGDIGCISFTGTTNVSAGDYKLSVTGTVHFDTAFNFVVTTYTLDTTISGFPLSSTFPITAEVSNPAGISEVAANVDLNVYPNPNQGNFTVRISSSSEINGTMSVVDELGRTINTQSIDVTGTKQIPLEMSNLSPGAYLLEINSANGRSVKQFIVK